MRRLILAINKTCVETPGHFIVKYGTYGNVNVKICKKGKLSLKKNIGKVIK